MKVADIFRVAPMSKPKRNTFNLSHFHDTTIRFGQLFPILSEPCYPGETWNFKTECFLRAMPLIAPVLTEVDVRLDAFYVPIRVLWDEFDDFIAGKLGTLNKAPYVTLGGSPANTPNPSSLADYIGFGTVPDGDQYPSAQFSAIPLAAYHKIYNHWYRSDQIQSLFLPDSLVTDENPDFVPYALGACQFRNWAHDYFTSALPTPSGAAENVSIPIAHAQAPMDMKFAADGSPAGIQGNLTSTPLSHMANVPGTSEIYTDPDHQGTIEDLRTANAVQKWLEKMGLGGSRFRELIYSFFGTDTGDARVDVPELLGTTINPVRISEVLSTAQTNNATNNDIENVVGQFAGHGMSLGSGPAVSYNVKEHGYIFVIANIQPKPSYFNQGRPRKYFLENHEDWMWPTFANIGDEPIYLSELYLKGENRTEVFGYQQRYAWLKHINNRISGEMSSDFYFWHLARQFDQNPQLTEEFIRAAVRDDIFAVQREDKDQFFVHFKHSIKAKRPLPLFAVPKLTP